MVTRVLQQVLERLNARKNRVLLIAQSSLPEHQFRAFRQLFLDEFGKSGLEKELERLFAEAHQLERNGTGRNTLCKKGGVP
jgi:hypothetical protein